jgi:protein-tyrosine kinase
MRLRSSTPGGNDRDGSDGTRASGGGGGRPAWFGRGAEEAAGDNWAPVKLVDGGVDGAVARDGGGMSDVPAFALLSPDDRRVHPAVTAAFESTSELAQSLRALRGAIMSARIDGRPIKTLSVLSIDAPNEGSILAANLAVVCAQAGYATLLVDANVENPGVHGLFLTANRGGLIEMLESGRDERKLPQETALSTLSVLPAGRQVPNALELVERRKLARALLPLHDMFDLIVIDASRTTLEASVVTDELDAAIVVVRQHVSPIGTLQQLIGAVESRGTKVLGAIVAT